MRRSTDRILTTHTGSLPRPPDLLEMLRGREDGQPVDPNAFAARVESAVQEVVRKQIESGVDVISDGELGKPSFATYVSHRIAGFGGENPDPRPTADWDRFPDWAANATRPNMKRRYCQEALSYAHPEAIEEDIRNLRAAMFTSGAEEGFIPAPSPGIVADINRNQYYATEEEYLFALADALGEEYRAITGAGFILQIDAPDAAMGRHSQFRHESLEEFRKVLGMRTAALNHALSGIPEEQVRFHVCWGNNESPHLFDVSLRDIIDLVLSVHAGAYSIEAANPRHAHEWKLWQDVKLPPGKLLIPGVIDSTTNFVEHPELVAQRIEQYASLVGRENVIAGTDCGFGTSAGRSAVHPSMVWPKLATLAEGAKIASDRLWP